LGGGDPKPLSVWADRTDFFFILPPPPPPPPFAARRDEKTEERAAAAAADAADADDDDDDDDDEDEDEDDDDDDDATATDRGLATENPDAMSAASATQKNASSKCFPGIIIPRSSMTNSLLLWRVVLEKIIAFSRRAPWGRTSNTMKMKTSVILSQTHMNSTHPQALVLILLEILSWWVSQSHHHHTFTFLGQLSAHCFAQHRRHCIVYHSTIYLGLAFSFLASVFILHPGAAPQLLIDISKEEDTRQSQARYLSLHHQAKQHNKIK
jgi:hypothetical protein